jgi:hypothetical protein
MLCPELATVSGYDFMLLTSVSSQDNWKNVAYARITKLILLFKISYIYIVKT